MSEKAKKPVGAVMVVGGGIAGIQASLDCAESGYKVYLVDKSSTIGGVMAQLDKTFPTNDCSMCIMSPKLVECGRHLNIETITNAEVAAVEGEAGNFKVTLARGARYIDPEKCTGCGICATHCPVTADNDFNEGLEERAAIFIKYPQAVPLAYMIDREICIGCGLCERMCLAEAVKYDDRDSEDVVEVGSIIAAPGFDEFDPTMRNEYGYKDYPNVVTSIEFERVLSASGPYRGRTQRPSDGEVPEKIAFIQCVGSRDVKCENEYCSSVCCMYAIKEAVIAKEHEARINPTIFYMDMRAYGKDFERYYVRAQNEYGVRFIQSRVASVQETDNNDLVINYLDEAGNPVTERFNLVVLSVGFEPPAGSDKLARALGIDIHERYGFAVSREFMPVATSRDGIYVCGAFQAPKDIPETVMQASAAAALAGGDLQESRGSLIKEKELPPERDIKGEPVRIGVFVCHCGINIGGYLSVPEVMDYAMTLPNVVYSERNLYTCSQDTQEKIKSIVHEKGLNRVIVASCSPRTHEPLFQETIREAGLNKYLFEMANIRDQCSWVHMKDPERATTKAKDLLRMAVAKARGLSPLNEVPVDINKAALVIGGGLAGLSAAKSISRQGYKCYLIERDAELGGNMRHIMFSLDGADPQAKLAELIKEVSNDPNIELFTEAEILSVGGYLGNFKTAFSYKGADKEIEHGIVIVAVGGREYEPTEHLYGRDERVVTQRELEEKLKKGEAGDAKNIVMIQCVGARNDERPYCSRFCCQEAVKNAIEIKKRNPEANVYVLYRDVRTYGLSELAYREAREAGVTFLNYTPERAPQVSKEGDELKVRLAVPFLGRELEISADLVALAVPAVAYRESEKLAAMLKVPINDDGFFLEAHVKLRPVDFATDGVFVCGLAHAPKTMEESIQQANAAVARACTVLAKDQVMGQGKISSVTVSRCIACGDCEKLCPFKAIQVEVVDERRGTKAAVVNAALCKGCGACAATCRCGAIDVQGFTNEGILAAIDAI